ncbi:MAG: CDP-alcohol phosphatidyltransferase family protein [Deltaproteobacteria bacterium]|nr:CDP-alcohol phosphatidyltransferase family protein [Deltaproteobacteria bacterium]
MASILNIANVFTGTRIAVLPLIFYAGYKDIPMLGVTIIAYSGIVDSLDGIVARKFNCATKFGEMLDAISDASMFVVALLTAMIFGYAGIAPSITLLALGVVNAGGRIIFIKRTGVITNFRSYASEVLGGVTFWVLVCTFLDYYIDTALWLLCLFSVIIIIHDYWRILTYPIEEVASE